MQKGNFKWAMIGLVLATILLSGCKIVDDNIIVRTLTQKEIGDINVKGCLVYGTVETPKDGQLSDITIMFANAPDLYLPTPNKNSSMNDVTPFLIELPYDCTGISRVGVKYSEKGFIREYFDTTGFKFTLNSNINIPNGTTNSNQVVTTNIGLLLVANSKGISTNNVVVISTNWVVEVSKNSALKNIFYIGRFTALNKSRIIDTEVYRYRVGYTNAGERDKEIFVNSFPALQNAKFYDVDVTQN